MKELVRKIIPAAALIIGLAIGLGIGNNQVKKEHKAAQDKIREANRKVVFMQKKMAEDINDMTVSMQQQAQADLEKVRNEKTAAEGQLGKLKAELAAKAREAEAFAAKADKKFCDMDKHDKDLDRKLKEATEEKHGLQAELKKTKDEKTALTAALKKKNEGLDHCVSNNARLGVIADELVKKYKNKGFGSIFLENEPLTQMKKVELEHCVQTYQEEIDQQKIRKQEAVKNAKQN